MLPRAAATSENGSCGYPNLTYLISNAHDHNKLTRIFYAQISGV